MLSTCSSNVHLSSSITESGHISSHQITELSASASDDCDTKDAEAAAMWTHDSEQVTAE